MLCKENDNFGSCVARAIIGGDVGNNMLKSIFGGEENPVETSQEPNSKISEKKAK